MLIPNVDYYRVNDPLFEGLRVLLTQRGETYTPAYIQGIAGAAFRIAADCPSAPTACAAMQLDELVRLLGYSVQTFTLGDAVDDPVTDIEAMMARIKAEINRGRPALVWHAFSFYEWDVVCEYDDARGVFIGRCCYSTAGGVVEEPQNRAWAGRGMTPYNALFLEQRTGVFPERQAKIDALTEAMAHAHSQLNK